MDAMHLVDFVQGVVDMNNQFELQVHREPIRRRPHAEPFKLIILW